MWRTGVQCQEEGSSREMHGKNSILEGEIAVFVGEEDGH